MKRKDVVFCINDAYVPYVLIALTSILDTNRDGVVVVHILTDGITDRNLSRLSTAVGKRGELYVYKVDDTPLRKLNMQWSIYTWYRILIPHYLSNVSRCLYLDADVIVAGDVTHLFEIDMTNKSIAGTVDKETYNDTTFQRLAYPKNLGYVCAGVLLMNLDYWREHDLAQSIIEFSQTHADKIVFPDQDAINYVCRETKVMLPLAYDIIHPFVTDERILKDRAGEIVEMLENPKIIHYAGFFPWFFETDKHILREYWAKYNVMSGVGMKKRYMYRGFARVKHGIKIVLDSLHLYDYKPWFRTTPRTSVEEVKNKIRNWTYGKTHRIH